MQLSSLNDITTTYRHIFLSPHYDDVIYSCGGTIGVQVSSGIHPLVITVFGGIPADDAPLSAYANQVQRGMGIDVSRGARGVIEQRRKEEANAANLLQFDYLWLDYLDAIYRGSPAYYNNRQQLIGGDIHPGDSWIDQHLAQDLLALRERLPDAIWYAPLGAGRHVDHQLVSSAADRLIQDGARVYLYEDFPYVLEPNAVETRKHELGIPLEPSLVEMSEMLPLRLEASSMYVSQASSNFGGLEEMRKGISDYAHAIRPVETVCIERYWHAR